MVLKRDLYGLKTALNSFHKYFGEFLRDLVFKPSISYKYLWIQKYDEYEGYYYIATQVDDAIIAAKNPSKYMHEIEMHFKFRDIADYPKYYLVNELSRVVNIIHVSSKKYLNEILRKYKKIHGDLKKEALPMRVTEHPELDYSPLLDEK